ncbi:MAG: class I SAM-dependent methyltransferase [Bryobacteraceae bacterium]|nr:class I SAM-dependent methyltransferase [Bryobacteraceae bacterium]
MGTTLLEHSESIDVTNRFVLRYAIEHGGRVLDYGCGAGKVVSAARAQGLEMFGTDVFYGGSQSRVDAQLTGLLGEVIREMSPEGTIPFPDGYFDLVTNNQVMEHVDDLDAVLAEIARVLRPGGTVLSVFPSIDVWREGHIGIPFSHWFPRGSRVRFLYTWLLRSLGLGTWKNQAPTSRQWAIDKLAWIDQWTRYRTRREIFESYNKFFTSTLRESDYIRFRLLDRPGNLRRTLANVMDVPAFAWGARALFRKLAFLVILSTKTA